MAKYKFTKGEVVYCNDIHKEVIYDHTEYNNFIDRYVCKDIDSDDLNYYYNIIPIALANPIDIKHYAKSIIDQIQEWIKWTWYKTTGNIEITYNSPEGSIKFILTNTY